MFCVSICLLVYARLQPTQRFLCNHARRRSVQTRRRCRSCILGAEVMSACCWVATRKCMHVYGSTNQQVLTCTHMDALYTHITTHIHTYIHTYIHTQVFLVCMTFTVGFPKPQDPIQADLSFFWNKENRGFNRWPDTLGCTHVCNHVSVSMCSRS